MTLLQELVAGIQERMEAEAVRTTLPPHPRELAVEGAVEVTWMLAMQGMAPAAALAVAIGEAVAAAAAVGTM